jgi:hypothetical protein
MRVAIVVGLLAGAACGPEGSSGQPGRGPTLPTQGQWSVVEFSRTEDCGTGPIEVRATMFHGFYLLHEGREGDLGIYLGAGPPFVDQMLCPIALNGEWECPAREWRREYNSTDRVVDIVDTLRGRTNGGDTPMSVDFHRVTMSSGSGALGRPCLHEESSIVELIGEHPYRRRWGGAFRHHPQPAPAADRAILATAAGARGCAGDHGSSAGQPARPPASAIEAPSSST